jgi:hypothetical protein
VPKCDACGQDCPHTLTSYNSDFSIASASCRLCRPENFADAFRDPSDQKIWPDHIANPQNYKRSADGIYRAKDELNQDTVDLMQVDPDAEETAKAQKKKRLNRRTTPMTPTEIEQACNKGADEWRAWRKEQEKLEKEAWVEATIQQEVYLDRVRREGAKIDGTIH